MKQRPAAKCFALIGGIHNPSNMSHRKPNNRSWDI